METNLTFFGNIAKCSELKDVPSKKGNFPMMEIELRTDDATQQRVFLQLTHGMAVQLSTCQLSPEMRVCAHLRLYTHDFEDRNGARRMSNDIRCWKLELFDAEDTVFFTCKS